MATYIPATQVDQPGTTTARTVVQTIIGVGLALGIVVPAAVSIIGEQWAPWLTPQALAVLATVSAVAAAISGTLARIMAIPTVNDWLRNVGLRVPGTVTTESVAPEGERWLDADGDGQPDTA